MFKNNYNLIEKLCQDIFMKITEYLTVDDIYNLLLTNKSILVNNNVISVNEINIDNPDILRKIGIFSKIKTNNLSISNINDNNQFQQIMSRCNFIKTLRHTCNELEPLQQLSNIRSSIEYLHLSNFFGNDFSFLQNLVNLKSLTIEKSHNFNDLNFLNFPFTISYDNWCLICYRI